MSQYAILSNKDGRTATTRPIPSPKAGEVLVRNVAVAANPKDWKLVDWVDTWQDVVEGNDVAGYVEAVGDGVTTFKKGDRVAGFSKMSTNSDAGAYQEYTIVPAHQTFAIGDAKFEDAATLPLAVMTAALGLYKHLNLLPLPSPSPKPLDQWILVNGASSSVGAFALQLAKLSGFKVLATAGSSAKVPRDLGADEVLDYRSLTPEQLQEAIKSKKITKVFDAISTNDTQALLASALQATGGGDIVTVLYVNEAIKEDKVTITREFVGTAYGENADFATEWYATFGQWLDKGILKPNVVKVLPNGLDSVDEGLKLLKADKVSGVKLVYRIADTPALKK